MNTMARLLLAAFALLATACSTILATPTPTPTPPPSPTATTTPRPTRTPTPTATPTPAHHPVPLETLKRFLRRDSTQAWDWRWEHTCEAFALRLIQNARTAGIEAYFVGVVWENGEEDHAIVSFRTTDAGTVFVEPQSDEFYDLPSSLEWAYYAEGDVFFVEYEGVLCTKPSWRPAWCWPERVIGLVEMRWPDYAPIQE